MALWLLPLALAVAPAEADKDASYRTDNFVVTAPSREVAERVGRAAERHRTELARLWFGTETPAWGEPCEVRVTISGDRGDGWTAFDFQDGKVVSQSIRLGGDLDDVLADILPGEVTHTLLASWSGRPLPRWVDAGAAALAESDPARAQYRRWLRDVWAEGRLVPLKRLLPARDFPKDLKALYAEGHSLSEFLVRRGGRAKFLEFVAQGQDDGWDKAAQNQYGYESVEGLESAWLTRVREGEGSEGRGAAEDRPGPPR